MSILVTGGAGYIGGHLLLALRDAGETMVVVDDLSNGMPWAIPAGVPFVRGDIGDEPLVRGIMREHRVDTLMHLAARLIGPARDGDPLEYYRTNTAKTCALLSAATACAVRHVVFSSTAAVYGNAPVNPVREDAPLAPLSAYGASKLMAERMLQDLAAASPIGYAILRYFNVAGADPLGRYGQSSTRTTLLVQIAVQAALGIRPCVEIYGNDYPTPDGTCIRDYIHVADLVEAHLAALRHLRGGGASFVGNCGYGHGYSVSEILDMAERTTGHRVERRIAPRRGGDVTEVYADASYIRSTLDWRPRYDDLATIVEHAARWEMQRQRMHGSPA
jgi:UDP-glucose 4-epimerase